MGGFAHELLACIQRLEEEAARRHPYPFLKLELDEAGLDPIVRGFVLTSKQAAEIKKELAKIGAPAVALQVLSEECLVDQWVSPIGDQADIWSAPSAERRLSSQVEPGDPTPQVVNVPGPPEGAICVRLFEGTIGWTRADQVKIQVVSDMGLCSRLADRDEVLGASRLESDFIHEALSMVDTPYLLGGRTASGIDCSGLVQRCLLRATGVLLPRHSSDQMRMGRRISPDQVQDGDVVYLTSRRGPKHMHAAIITGMGNSAIHASRQQRRVVVDAVSDLFELYEVLSYRRFIRRKG